MRFTPPKYQILEVIYQDNDPIYLVYRSVVKKNIPLIILLCAIPIFIPFIFIRGLWWELETSFKDIDTAIMWIDRKTDQKHNNYKKKVKRINKLYYTSKLK